MVKGKRNSVQLLGNSKFNQFSSHEISGKIKRDKNKKILILPLNNTNNFANIDYEVHLTTKS